MRTAVAAGVTGFLGAAGAIAGFQQMAPVAQADDTAGPGAAPADAGAVPVTKVRFKKCDAGFELESGSCVRTVQRTLVVDVAGLAAPQTPASPSVPANGGAGVTVGDQGGGFDDHGGDDDGFDDQGFDDHGFDDHRGDRDDDRQDELEDERDDRQDELEDQRDDERDDQDDDDEDDDEDDDDEDDDRDDD